MNILKFDHLDSTNNHAKMLINAGEAVNWQVISTVEQSAGRGQATNIWESERGKNLTFSLLFKPEKMEPKKQFCISQAVAIGLVNYLKSRIDGHSIHIKWPNDSYVGLKKIAGTLIEHRIQGNQILFSIIGVGLNVNQSGFSEQAGNPTSLSIVNNAQYDLDIELNALLGCIEPVFEILKVDDLKNLRSEYLKHLLFLGEEREYVVRSEKIIGKIIGVNAFGCLQIQGKNGTLFECGLKEVIYIF